MYNYFMSQILSNSEIFHKFFLEYCSLLDDAFETYDNLHENEKREYKLKIAELLKILSYLRGDDGMFLTINRSRYIDEYYKLESLYYKKFDALNL